MMSCVEHAGVHMSEGDFHCSHMDRLERFSLWCCEKTARFPQTFMFKSGKINPAEALWGETDGQVVFLLENRFTIPESGDL